MQIQNSSNMNKISSNFTMFLEDVKHFRHATSDKKSINEFLGKLTLSLNDFPQDDEIETMFKSNVFELYIISLFIP